MSRALARLGIGCVTLLALIAASPAHAEPTRAAYVTQLEPICKSNAEANRRALKGVRARVKADKLGKAAAQFARAANAFARTIDALAAVPRPSADAPTLAEWFRYLSLEEDYLRKISKALKEDERGKAQGFAVRLQRNANLTNGLVLGFGFSECLIDPSKFS